MIAQAGRAWGPLLLGDGRVRFRLWAPGEEGLMLVAGHDQVIGMVPVGDGWFEIETDAVGVGDAYAFRLGSGLVVPDPGARQQVGDVHGPSLLTDPDAYFWRISDWRGRPWEEAVLYELNIGCYAPSGDFDGAIDKLDHLVDLGVTAIELMPVAQFSGRRGWGYDGVLLYAPHSAYGSPCDLKRLVDCAHERGLMVILDVVYNHFGPDGNYIGHYAPQFFHAGLHTPWGAAIAYENWNVRRFFIDNALYWLREFRFDGLRFDAIDQIRDPSEISILEELAMEVREKIPDRLVHLTTEDDRNIVRFIARDEANAVRLFSAEWNDDFHHVAHVVLTGEADGYYQDYVHEPAALMARALSEGFVQQGEPSPYRDGALRGEPSGGLPPVSFINFLQNHDQVGNRAFGERIAELAPASKVEMLTAILLLSPGIPLLFMGEEWGSTRPFCYFTDFSGELGALVREGRRREFRKWPQFHDAEHRERIPDPNAASTFDASRLDWGEAMRNAHRDRLDVVKGLLKLRAEEIVPRLSGLKGGQASRELFGPQGFQVTWRLADGARLAILANFSQAAQDIVPRGGAMGRVLYRSRPGLEEELARGEAPPSSVLITLAEVI